MALELSSPAFEQGEQGDNVSPPLRWRGIPDGTRSLVLLCNDPDARGGIFRHWAIYDIPPDRMELKEGFGPESLHDGLKEAINSFGKPGYGGPCPPQGDRAHH
jgi:Raf kinase inhibitor-like YbhB/YbcL family protein